MPASVADRTIRYQILPYSNAEFAESLRGNRALGWTHAISEKAAEGSVTTRYGAAGFIPSFFEMDPCVASIKGTPFRLWVEARGRTGTFVPDFEVTTVAGDVWYLKVEEDDTWLDQYGAAAFRHAGMPLLVVSADLLASDFARGNGWGENMSRGFPVLPEMAREIAELVDGTGGRIQFRQLIGALRENGWATRDPSIAETMDRYSDKEGIFTSMAICNVFRAVREGYIDHDPTTGAAGMNGFIHSRHAFLDRHDVIGALSPYFEAGDKDALAAISQRAQEKVRSFDDPRLVSAPSAGPR